MATRAELQQKMADKLRGRYKGAHQRTVDLAEEAFHDSPLRQMMRSPDFQRLAAVYIQRFPGLDKFRQKGEPPGAALGRALIRLSDPSKDRDNPATGEPGNAKLLGLDPRASRDEVLAAVAEYAPELGGTPSEVASTLSVVGQAASSGELLDRMFQRDAEVERQKPESSLPADKPMGERAQDEAERHNLVRNVAREKLHAEAAAAPLMAQRRSRYFAPSERHADVYEAWAIANGIVPDIDPVSPGYLHRLRNDGATARDIAAVKERDDAEWVAAKLEETQTSQREAAAFEDSLTDFPEEAADAATGGGSDG
jgi:hypothetical protein